MYTGTVMEAMPDGKKMSGRFHMDINRKNTLYV